MSGKAPTTDASADALVDLYHKVVEGLHREPYIAVPSKKLTDALETQRVTHSAHVERSTEGTFEGQPKAKQGEADPQQPGAAGAPLVLVGEEGVSLATVDGDAAAPLATAETAPAEMTEGAVEVEEGWRGGRQQSTSVGTVGGIEGLHAEQGVRRPISLVGGAVSMAPREHARREVTEDKLRECIEILAQEVGERGTRAGPVVTGDVVIDALHDETPEGLSIRDHYAALAMSWGGVPMEMVARYMGVSVAELADKRESDPAFKRVHETWRARRHQQEEVRLAYDLDVLEHWQGDDPKMWASALALRYRKLHGREQRRQKDQSLELQAQIVELKRHELALRRQEVDKPPMQLIFNIAGTPAAGLPAHELQRAEASVLLLPEPEVIEVEAEVADEDGAAADRASEVLAEVS